MRVGIKEIAERANVSVSAVSIALNNKQGVSESTRNKILEVAKELKYPYIYDSSKSAKATTIKLLKIYRHGHILNSNHEYFVADYIKGIMESAHLHKVGVEIDAFDSTRSIRSIAKIISEDSEISGYIILATELVSSDIKTLLETGKEMVFIDSYFYDLPADYVTMNNREAVYKAIAHFKDAGYRDVGFFSGNLFTPNFYIREEAYYLALQRYGFKVNKDWIFKVDCTYEGAYEDMKRYLEAGASLPQAAFASNDVTALGCMRALQEYGVRIPGDIAIVGFDNLPMSQMCSPTLTTLDISKVQIGRLAHDQLFLKIQHINEGKPVVSMISVDLIVRESSRKNNE